MFEEYSELFDTSDGGALYVREIEDGYGVAGVLWLDGGYDALHYFAFEMDVADCDYVDEIYVTDIFSAAEAFTRATDPYVSYEIGWFHDMDEAVAAVEDYVQNSG